MYLLAIKKVEKDKGNSGYHYPHVCPILSDLYEKYVGTYSTCGDVPKLFPEFYAQKPKRVQGNGFYTQWWSESTAGTTARINALKSAVLLIDPDHKFK